jgi:hypothetical protein
MEAEPDVWAKSMRPMYSNCIYAAYFEGVVLHGHVPMCLVLTILQFNLHMSFPVCALEAYFYI